jgi:hypothetical protein
LGYDPDTLLRDKSGRPQPLLTAGAVVREVLA